MSNELVTVPETKPKLPMGRPLKFKSPKAFDRKVDEYFKQAKYPTITGLAVFLNTSRETLREYKERPEFVDSIKKALDKCQAVLEERALSNRYNPTMAIFSLKNNYGWRDQSEIDHKSNGRDMPTPITVQLAQNRPPELPPNAS